MDKALFIAVIPAVLLIVIMGWILMLMRGGRAINLRLIGLGIEVAVATSDPGRTYVPKRAEDFERKLQHEQTDGN